MTVVNYPFWTDIFFTSPFTLTHYIISSSIPTYIHLNLQHTLFFFFALSVIFLVSFIYYLPQHFPSPLFDFFFSHYLRME